MASDLLAKTASISVKNFYLGGYSEMADDEGSGPGNFVWAIALIIIVAIVAAVVMSGGFLSRGDKNIDVEIKTPAR